MITISINVRSSLLLGIIRSTYKHYGKSRPSLNNAKGWDKGENFIRGLPDTWQFSGATTSENGHVVLTPELQYMWYNECIKLWPSHSKDDYNKSFNSMTTNDRWTTNGYGSNTCAVYPTNKNISNEPMRYFTLLTGNAVIEILGNSKYIYGKLMWPFRAINSEKPINNISYETHPFLFYKPMNSTRDPIMNDSGKWTGKYIEDGYERFPQFGGKSITPIFMPNTDVAWIDVNYVEILQPGSILPETFNK